MTEIKMSRKELEKKYFLGVSENHQDLFNNKSLRFCIEALNNSVELEGKGEIISMSYYAHGFEWADYERDLKYLGRMTFVILSTWEGHDNFRVSKAYVFPYEKEAYFKRPDLTRVSLGNGGYFRELAKARESFKEKIL